MNTNPTNDETKPSTTPQEVVYLGRVELKSGIAGTFVLASTKNLSTMTLDDLDEIASPFAFSKAKLPRVIGGIYTAPVTIEGGRLQRLAPSYKYTGEFISNPSLIAAAEHRDKSVEVAERARKLEAKAKADGALAKHLAPLKRDFFSTDHIGRLAMEVVILAELRKGRA